jgi:hypothetical protein
MSRFERAVIKKGLTASTARWLEDLAKELGVGEKRLFKAVLRLAKHGIWLEAEDWQAISNAIDLSRHLEMAVDYVIRRASAGVPPAEAVKELPKAVEKAGKLAHIRELLSNII